MSENLPIPSPVDPTPGPPGNTCEPGGHRTTFAVPLTVRFVEADRAGIAFFGRAFEYAHAALEELLLAAGCPIRETFDRRGWGLPIVHAEADYRRPLVLGDRLVVEVGVHRVGSSSISLEFGIRGELEHEARVRVRLVQVCVALPSGGGRVGSTSFQPQPLPRELLEGLGGLGLLAHLPAEPGGGTTGED